MKIITLILGVCFYSLAFSQTTYVNEVWNSSGSTQASHLRSISKTDLYGNVYVAGATFNGSNYDAYIRKYNSGGTIDWTYQYDANEADDFISDFLIDSNSNLYITGAVTDSTLDSFDMFIAKLDYTGTLQWSDTYDGPDGGADIGFSLTSDPGFNNIYIAGTSWITHNHWDMLVCKYSSSGVRDWLIREDYNNGYDGAVRLSYFPSLYAFVDGLWQLVTDEHVSIIALSYDSVMYDLNTVSTHVECDSGNIISSSISSVIGTNPDLQIRHIVQDHLRNVYATGSILNIGTSNIDLFTIKMNPSLSLVWSSTYDGPESLTDVGHMLAVDSMGNVYIAGYTTSSNTGEDLLLVKFDSSGSLEWTRKFDGGERKNGQADLLTFTEEGHLTLSGWAETSGNMEVLTLTYSSNGEILWMASHDGDLDINKPTAIAVGADQSLFVTYLSGVSGFGMSACSTLKYTYIHRELEVDTTDTVSNHHFIKSELVVRINPKLVNTTFVDNKELSFALLSEILPDSAYDSIMSVMPYYDYEPTIFKIYDFLKSTDSISISRQGDTVILPSFWSSFIMELPANDSIHAIAGKLEELGNIVIHAHTNGIVVLHNEPDDTYYSSQISLQPNTSPATKINAEGAWSYQGADGAYEVGRPEVKVCVVDGGFAPAHEDFDFVGNGIREESVVKGGLNYQTSTPISIWDDPVANGPLGSGDPIHGTAVAGIIGAVRNNNKGIAGIAGGNGMELRKKVRELACIYRRYYWVGYRKRLLKRPFFKPVFQNH